MATRDLEKDVDALSKSIDALRSDFSTLIGQLSETAQHAVSAGKSTAKEKADQLGAQLDTGVQNLRQEISNRPLSTFGLAFVAGLVIGTLVNR